MHLSITSLNYSSRQNETIISYSFPAVNTPKTLIEENIFQRAFFNSKTQNNELVKEDILIGTWSKINLMIQECHGNTYLNINTGAITPENDRAISKFDGHLKGELQKGNERWPGHYNTCRVA